MDYPGMVHDSHTSHVHDVVILGGGPSGLAVAAELAFHGVHSVLIEPRVEVSYDRPRAKTTSIRTMEHFRRWGVADAVRARAPLAASWSQRVVFCDSAYGSVITEFDHVFGLSSERLEFAAELGQQVPQPIVEDVLREHLGAGGHADMRFGDRARRVFEQDDAVVVTVERADGSTYEIRARYVIGCEGGSSPSREAIGAVLQGASAPHSNLNVVLTSRALRPPLGEAVHYWVVGAESPGVLGRLDHQGRWWASIAAAGDVTDPRGARELVANLVGVDAEELDLEVHSLDPWTPRMLLADRFASERIFLVGESAHLNPPFGGHGFNTCVGDAVNLGWKLAAVLNGWGGPHLLATYEAERRGVAAETIASATANLRASGVGIAQTAEALQETKAEEFHSLGLVLGYSYAGSPIVASGAPATATDVRHYEPSFAPGARLPHTWLESGRSLYDDLGTDMSLLVPRSVDAGSIRAIRERTAAASSAPLTVVTVRDGLTGADGQLVLVRPDQHVAWSGFDVADMDMGLVTGWSPRT